MKPVLVYRGRIGDWRYEAMVIPALNANMFNHSG